MLGQSLAKPRIALNQMNVSPTLFDINYYCTSTPGQKINVDNKINVKTSPPKSSVEAKRTIQNPVLKKRSMLR